ncbi:hypothetical protein WAI453_006526 [Rhynchosporium graminicola]
MSGYPGQGYPGSGYGGDHQQQAYGYQQQGGYQQQQGGYDQGGYQQQGQYQGGYPQQPQYNREQQHGYGGQGKLPAHSSYPADKQLPHHPKEWSASATELQIPTHSSIPTVPVVARPF